MSFEFEKYTHGKNIFIKITREYPDHKIKMRLTIEQAGVIVSSLSYIEEDYNIKEYLFYYNYNKKNHEEIEVGYVKYANDKFTIKLGDMCLILNQENAITFIKQLELSY